MSESLSPFKRNNILGKSYNSEVFRFGSKVDALGASRRSKMEASTSRIQQQVVTPDPPNPVNEYQVTPPFEMEDPEPLDQNQIISQEPINYVSSTREDKNAGLRLSVLCLKLQMAILLKQNKNLKTEISVHKTNEVNYSQKLHSLASVLEDLQLTERLDNEKPSELLKNDIDEIDVVLNGIYSKLDVVTGDQGNDNYLNQVLAKQKEFFMAADENAFLIEKLHGSVSKFKNTILSEGGSVERGSKQN